MPAFIRRVRRSLRPRSGQILSTNVVANHRSQSYNDQQSTEHFDTHEDPENDGRNSPPPLPVIVDRGPPNASRYADADVFWNSTLIEADDHDKDWLVTGMVKRRLKVQSPKVQSPVAAEHNQHEESRVASEDIKGEGRKTSPLGIAAARQRRQGSFKRLGRDISYGREGADNDVTVLFYTMPDLAEIPATTSPQQTSSEPLSPRTRDGDNFIDFPSTNSAETHTAFPERPDVAFEDSAAISAPITAIQEEKALPDIPAVHKESNPPSRQTSLDPSTVISWNICLNQF
jgi:hypothetical protein